MLVNSEDCSWKKQLISEYGVLLLVPLSHKTPEDKIETFSVFFKRIFTVVPNRSLGP